MVYHCKYAFNKKVIKRIIIKQLTWSTSSEVFWYSVCLSHSRQLWTQRGVYCSTRSFASSSNYSIKPLAIITLPLMSERNEWTYFCRVHLIFLIETQQIFMLWLMILLSKYELPLKQTHAGTHVILARYSSNADWCLILTFIKYRFPNCIERSSMT